MACIRECTSREKALPFYGPICFKGHKSVIKLEFASFFSFWYLSESLPSGGIWLGGKSQVWDVYNLRDYNQHVSDDGTALWATTCGGCSARYPFIICLFRYNPDKSLGEGFSHTVNVPLISLPPPPLPVKGLLPVVMVIWLCVYIRYWPYHGVGTCASLLKLLKAHLPVNKKNTFGHKPHFSLY